MKKRTIDDRIRRIYALGVVAILSIALAQPALVMGQPYETTLQAGMDGYLAYDHWWVYGVNSNDGRASVQSFGILGLPVPPDYIYVAPENGWYSFVTAEIDNTTSVWWLAAPDNEIYPGQQKQVWLWVAHATNTGRGGSCIAGGELAVCAGLNVAAW